MRSELVLVTAPDAVIPADGALLVGRREVEPDGKQGDAHWTVKDASDHVVAIVVEDLGSDLERWQLGSVADRDLRILDEAGTLIAKVHQSAHRGPGTLASPAPSRFTSTLRRDARAPTYGVPGSTTKLVLGRASPTGAQYLTIAVVGTGGHAHSSLVPTANQRTFETTTSAGKSCAFTGPGPLAVGQRVALTWVDVLGRRSAATEVTISKQR
ncbi:hypothetical protein BH11MYX1_BH11MYX1_43740 [soil metagenome]